jgi:hypothetical protein
MKKGTPNLNEITLKSLPKELRKLHKKSELSLYIDPDSDIKKLLGKKYTEEQLTKYLLQFVKSCKKLNNESPIHIFCVMDDKTDEFR